MTVSVSAPPEQPATRRFAGTAQVLPGAPQVYVLAAGFLAAHLPFLSPSLEDFDSINFALGLHDFDPARHQPHPPGSPVYVAIGRVVLATVSALRSGLGSTEAEALTLALMSAVAGAVALVAAYHVFLAVSSSARAQATAMWATALLGVAPLFWLSGLRPMSDLPGLAAALAAQALLLRGRVQTRALLYGALLAGIAAGLRVQTVWLTVPLLCLMMVAQRRQGIGWLLTRPVAACALGALAWAVPLVLDSGGLSGYLRALSTQAGEDFAWVSMLWLEPTPRKLAFTLYETGVLPWGAPALAAVVAVAAVAGGLVMLFRDRPALGVLLVAFAPYAVFHLLFQETVTVRYALPTLPLVAYLATRGLALAPRLGLVTAPVVVGALVVAVPAGVAYGNEAHPAFRAIAAASHALNVARPAAVFSHQSVWRALQAEPAGLPAVEPRRSYEWLGPVQYWKDGGSAVVWFLADPRRTDLALIDPEARRDVVRFSWAAAGLPELGGARPLGTDWYRMPPPGWFAGEGWSLTPETGGLAQATAAGPDHRPIEMWVRRRSGPVHLVVGGRHLGDAGDPPEEFTLSLDGVDRDRWTLTVDQRNFLRFLELPDGVPGAEGTYALLTIAARAGPSATPRAFAAIRQFDLQSADRIVYGFGDGWHEDEYDPATGRRWRWTSERSIVRFAGPPAPLALTIRGESPLRYLDTPPVVRIMAGSREVARRAIDDDFTWTVTLSRDDVAGAGGAIAIETDRVYFPGVEEGTADDRHLGLRLYEFRLDPSSP